MNKTLNLVGQKFGKLTILEIFRKDKYYHKSAKCICDCGKEHSTYLTSLISGDCKSCGCLRLSKNNREDIIWKRYFYQGFTKNKPRDKRKNLIHTLELLDFKKLCLLPCFYCGTIYDRELLDNDLNNSIKIKSNTTIKCNGIDRINSNIGYTKENCVPCCKKCNLMKNVLSVKDFEEHIFKIFNHLTKDN
jgi:hypothetical protein